MSALWALVLLVGALIGTIFPASASAETTTTTPLIQLYLAGRNSPAETAEAQHDERFWGALLTRTGKPWRRATSLDQVVASRHTVLVVGLEDAEPTQRELHALAQLQRAGMPVLVSGRPSGDTAASVLRRLLGIPMRLLPVKDDLSVSTIGHTPITGALSAGTRVFSQLGPFWVPQGKGTWRTAAEFTDWSYRPPSSGPAPAVVYGKQLNRRWVYLAAERHDLEPDEAVALGQLLGSAFDWLSGTSPAATHLANWPDGFRSAQLVQMDTELDDRKDTRMLDAALTLGQWVAAVGGSASFYCVTGDLALRPTLLDALAAQGHDLGLHGERHEPFGGGTAQEQTARVQAMWSQWKKLRGAAAVATEMGFRAPFESYDIATERALADVGIGYHVSDAASATHRLPHFVDLGNGRRMLRLPRSQPDDYNFSVEKLDGQALKQVLRIDAQSAQRLGGLGLLSLHPQYFTEGPAMGAALPGWLADLPRGPNGVWLTSGARIAAWWQQRDRLKWKPSERGVQLDIPTQPSDQRFAFIVDADLRGLAVRSSDPQRMTVVSVQPWPDTRGPVWQTAVTVRLHEPGPVQLTWQPPARSRTDWRTAR